MDPLPPIPIPPGQRWREFRLQAIPIIVFLTALSVVVIIWRGYVSLPTLMGEVEVIREVPVDKVVVRDVEVVREVPVEKVVEKEVIREVPVDRIVPCRPYSRQWMPRADGSSLLAGA